MKITQISTYGSCTSRNIFNSKINKDYKKYFKINKSVEASTLISLMSKPIDFDEKLLKTDNKYDLICIKDDLSKNFLDFIKQDPVDYIILDTLFDASSQIIKYSENQFITSSTRIKKTELYPKIADKEVIDICNNFDEYYSLWKDSCDRFFKIISKYCKHSKIVLNCSRQVYTYLDLQKNLQKNENFEILANKFNPIRNILDKYILEHFDVEVLQFNHNIHCDQNHIFGLEPSHYETKYYLDKTKQLIEIINRNNKYEFQNKINIKIREDKRKCTINSFNLNKLSNKRRKIFDYEKKYINNDLNQILNQFNTARIDIKNINDNENLKNTIKISNISDFNLEYNYPIWFKNNDGKGISIQSKQNFLKFDIECIGDGILHIFLRGIDVQINKKQIPIFINYKKFLINDSLILNENILVSHESFYLHKIPVKDGEKITLYVEWIPYKIE